MDPRKDQGHAMTTATIAKPWYREFWPWFLMAGPFLAMLGCFITMYFAFTQFSNQPIQEEGLVKRGLVIEHQGAGRRVRRPSGPTRKTKEGHAWA